MVDVVDWMEGLDVSASTLYDACSQGSQPSVGPLFAIAFSSLVEPVPSA